MKRICFSRPTIRIAGFAALFLLFGHITAFAQSVGINDTNANPDPSAMLDVQSTSRGMLIPRMTSVQRTAISAPAVGLLVFDMTTQSFWFRDNSGWVELKVGGSAGWSLAGNANTDPATNFIGTTDDKSLVFRVNDTEQMTLDNQGRLFLIGSGNNTVVGNQALFKNTTGVHNVAFGSQALYNNVDGGLNVAIGRRALFANTSSSYNTAVGYEAMRDNTIGKYNTAMGNQALIKNLSGDENIAIGQEALFSNTTGSKNTIVGSMAGFTNTDASGNCFLGYQAGINNNGNNNCFLGVSAGKTNISGFRNTCIGYDTYLMDADFSNATAIGADAVVTASNSVRIGNDGVTSIGGAVGWTNFSDARIKTGIQENIPGLSFIQKLRPVTYHYDIHRESALRGIVDTTNWKGKYDIEKMVFSGFIAQEVEQAAHSIGYDFSGVDAPTHERGLYGLRYAEFTVPLVKAVQEQQQIIQGQKTELTELKTQLTDMQQQMRTLLGELKSIKTTLAQKEAEK